MLGCGGGGASRGMQLAGCNVVLAVDAEARLKPLYDANRGFGAPLSVANYYHLEMWDALAAASVGGVQISTVCCDHSPTKAVDPSLPREGPRSALTPLVIQKLVDQRVPVIWLENVIQLQNSVRGQEAFKIARAAGYHVSLLRRTGLQSGLPVLRNRLFAVMARGGADVQRALVDMALELKQGEALPSSVMMPRELLGLPSPAYWLAPRSTTGRQLHSASGPAPSLQQRHFMCTAPTRPVVWRPGDQGEVEDYCLLSLPDKMRLQNVHYMRVPPDVSKTVFCQAMADVVIPVVQADITRATLRQPVLRELLRAGAAAQVAYAAPTMGACMVDGICTDAAIADMGDGKVLDEAAALSAVCVSPICVPLAQWQHSAAAATQGVAAAAAAPGEAAAQGFAAAQGVAATRTLGAAALSGVESHAGAVAPSVGVIMAAWATAAHAATAAAAAARDPDIGGSWEVAALAAAAAAATRDWRRVSAAAAAAPSAAAAAAAAQQPAGEHTHTAAAAAAAAPVSAPAAAEAHAHAATTAEPGTAATAAAAAAQQPMAAGAHAAAAVPATATEAAAARHPAAPCARAAAAAAPATAAAAAAAAAEAFSAAAAAAPTADPVDYWELARESCIRKGTLSPEAGGFAEPGDLEEAQGYQGPRSPADNIRVMLTENYSATRHTLVLAEDVELGVGFSLKAVRLRLRSPGTALKAGLVQILDRDDAQAGGYMIGAGVDSWSAGQTECLVTLTRLAGRRASLRKGMAIAHLHCFDWDECARTRCASVATPAPSASAAAAAAQQHASVRAHAAAAAAAAAMGTQGMGGRHGDGGHGMDERGVAADSEPPDPETCPCAAGGAGEAAHAGAGGSQGGDQRDGFKTMQRRARALARQAAELLQHESAARALAGELGEEAAAVARAAEQEAKRQYAARKERRQREDEDRSQRTKVWRAGARHDQPHKLWGGVTAPASSAADNGGDGASSASPVAATPGDRDNAPSPPGAASAAPCLSPAAAAGRAAAARTARTAANKRSAAAAAAAPGSAAAAAAAAAQQPMAARAHAAAAAAPAPAAAAAAAQQPAEAHAHAATTAEPGTAATAAAAAAQQPMAAGAHAAAAAAPAPAAAAAAAQQPAAAHAHAAAAAAAARAAPATLPPTPMQKLHADAGSGQASRGGGPAASQKAVRWPARPCSRARVFEPDEPITSAAHEDAHSLAPCAHCAAGTAGTRCGEGEGEMATAAALADAAVMASVGVPCAVATGDGAFDAAWRLLLKAPEEAATLAEALHAAGEEVAAAGNDGGARAAAEAVAAEVAEAIRRKLLSFLHECRLRRSTRVALRATVASTIRRASAAPAAASAAPELTAAAETAAAQQLAAPRARAATAASAAAAAAAQPPAAPRALAAAAAAPASAAAAAAAQHPAAPRAHAAAAAAPASQQQQQQQRRG